MEWYKTDESNKYNLSVNVSDDKNTVDVFVKRDTDVYRGRDNNTSLIVLLDVLKKKKADTLSQNKRCEEINITLSYQNDSTGLLVIKNLKTPDICSIALSKLDRDGIIYKLYGANEEIMAVKSLLNLKNIN
jgi:hypothetical protein